MRYGVGILVIRRILFDFANGDTFRDSKLLGLMQRKLPHEQVVWLHTKVQLIYHLLLEMDNLSLNLIWSRHKQVSQQLSLPSISFL